MLKKVVIKKDFCFYRQQNLLSIAHDFIIKSS